MRRGLYKRGGIYWLRYAGTGGRIVFESAKTSNLKQAEAILTKRKADVLEGKVPVRFTKRYTFQELSKEYLDWATRQKSYKDKRNRLGQLLKVFGNLPLEMFTTMRVEQYQSERLKVIKPASVNRLLSLLKHTFTKAVEWNMVSEEALKRIRKVKQLPENNRRLRYLNPEECQALIESCVPHLKPIVITALNTGMRLGEILNLKWEQVDLRNGFILLDKTKNNERREIPINATLTEVLEAMPHSVESLYVFVNRDGNPYKGVKTSFATALKRTGIQDFKFHDLRHTFASCLVMGGVDIITVKELLGHKSLTMTLRYAHLAPSHQVKALRVLDARLNNSEAMSVSELYKNYTIPVYEGERESHKLL